ncbi:MAG: hypothetical protein IJ571_00530 [Ruminococcus sp.]|nr:hypothetical protein [Ruminococcus sp.]
MEDNTNIIYQYPEESNSNRFENAFYEAKKNRDKQFKKAIIAFFISVIFLILFALPALNKFSTVFLICFILLLVVGMHILKALTASITHLCGINALENDMTITYYSFNRASKRVYHIRYEDIVKARFSDSDFSAFQIVYKPSNESYEEDYNDKGERIDDEKLKTNLILIKLNKGTYEQGFFLYIAKTLFKIDAFKASKVEDKYGTAEAFFQALAE